MTGKYEVVHSTVTTVSTTQDITASAGFGDVCCVMFYFTGGVIDGTEAPNAITGCGATDFVRQWVGVGYSEDNIATTNCVTMGATDACIGFPTETGGWSDFEATASKITDGVKLTWNTTPTKAYQFSTIFFGGSSLNFEVGTKLNDNSVLDSSQVITFTDMTVAPEVLIFHLNGVNAFSSPTVDNETSWGLATASAGVFKETAYGFGDDDGRGPGGRHGAWVGNQHCMKLGAYTGSRTGYTLSAVGVNGTPRGTFTLYKRDVAATLSYGYVALSWGGLGNYHVSIPNLGVNSTGITTPPSLATPGFRPQFLLSFGSNLQNLNANNSAALGGVGGVQIIDSINNNPGSHQWGSDEVDPIRAFSLFDSEIVDMRTEASSVHYTSTWEGWTDDSWAINVSVATSNAKRWPVLVLGFDSSAGGDPDPGGANIPLMWGRAF